MLESHSFFFQKYFKGLPEKKIAGHWYKAFCDRHHLSLCILHFFLVLIYFLILSRISHLARNCICPFSCVYLWPYNQQNMRQSGACNFCVATHKEITCLSLHLHSCKLSGLLQWLNRHLGLQNGKQHVREGKVMSQKTPEGSSLITNMSEMNRSLI